MKILWVTSGTRVFLNTPTIKTLQELGYEVTMVTWQELYGSEVEDSKVVFKILKLIKDLGIHVLLVDFASRELKFCKSVIDAAIKLKVKVFVTSYATDFYRSEQVYSPEDLPSELRGATGVINLTVITISDAKFLDELVRK